ncbi:uncharacterized protein [Oscarella lobularis]|uniref:uncharacterized protein n=1 Tax=Oscarella lobularis TaxID=121494 RepID=UPI0033134C80
MAQRLWPTFIAAVLLAGDYAHLAAGAVQTTQCSSNATCGRQSTCTSSTCKCIENYGSLTGTDCELLDTSCHTGQRDCVKCEGTTCLRCLSGLYVTPPNGECIDDCSSGTATFVVSGERFLGRICEETSGGGGFSTTYVIIICVIVVVIIALAITLVVVLRLKRRSRGFWAVNDPAVPDSAVNMRQRRPETTEETKRESKRISKDLEARVNKGYVGDDPEEWQLEEFLGHLAKLRDKASAFLAILNDMRRKMKTLSPDSEGAKQCKKVMKDLTRLLFLLNKKPKSIKMPSDGLQLLTWSEHVLTRFQENNPERAEEIEKDGGQLTEEELQQKIKEDETHF